MILLAVWNLKSIESYMNLLTLPLVNPRHHIGKLKGFAYLLFEAFMRAYFDAWMKLLYPLCLVRHVEMQSRYSWLNPLTHYKLAAWHSKEICANFIIKISTIFFAPLTLGCSSF